MPHVKYFWEETEDNVIREYDENNNTIANYTTGARQLLCCGVYGRKRQ